MEPITTVTCKKLLAMIPWNATQHFEVNAPRADGSRTVPIVTNVIDPNCGLRRHDRIRAIHDSYVRRDSKHVPGDEFRSLLFNCCGVPRMIEVVRIQYPEGPHRLSREEEREQALDAIDNMPDTPTDVIVPSSFQGIVNYTQDWLSKRVAEAIEIPLPTAIASKKRRAADGHLEVGEYNKMVESMRDGGCSLAKLLVFMHCCPENDPRDAALLFQRVVLPELKQTYRFKAKVEVDGRDRWMLLAPWDSHKPKGTDDEDAHLSEEPDEDLDEEEDVGTDEAVVAVGNAGVGGAGGSNGAALAIRTASDRIKLAIDNARRRASGSDVNGLVGHEYDDERNNLADNQFPLMPKGKSEVQDEHWCALYDEKDPKPLNSLITNRPKVVTNHLKKAQERRGSAWIILDQVIRKETTHLGHLIGAILYEMGDGGLKMYPEEWIKNGRGYRLPFGWLCSATILNLPFSRLGFLPGNPIGGGQSTAGKLWAQGWYEDRANANANGTVSRKYSVVQVKRKESTGSVVQKPLMKRVLIATYGYNYSSIRRDGGGLNWDSKSTFDRACVVTLINLENSNLSQHPQVVSFLEAGFGSEFRVGKKLHYKGVDSHLTVQHAVHVGMKPCLYIDAVSQMLCPQIEEAKVEDNAVVFAPCYLAFSNMLRKPQMQLGDSRGITAALRNEYWGILRRFKPLFDATNDAQRRQTLYALLHTTIKDLGRPVYLCYFCSEADVLVGNEEKKYLLLPPTFARYLIRSDLHITQT